MKKIISLNLSLVLLLLCGCAANQENSDTRFMLDTVVTLTATCNSETLDGAFLLCQDYEKMLSRTIEGSDTYNLNTSNGFVEVNEHTKNIIERSVYYGDLSNGKFDITIYPVSSLWDFNGEVIPSHNEIAEALKNVDYQSIEINKNNINLNGKQIDLGGIAKGYIADRLLEYFKQNNTPEGIIDLGGNIIVWGKRDYTIGIKKPFSNGDLAAKIKINNKTVVTSGTYERYIPTSIKIYHHILDPETGYACESNLSSATIIGNSSFDADALSTLCILVGLEKAKEIIENTPDTEAVFIDTDGNLHYTTGLSLNNQIFTLK
ncbi:MAG: FAD:protein FMN transferase [Clostridia bacterium]|nr:FAD:protein FMN transferase [Clostridia bacterium]